MGHRFRFCTLTIVAVLLASGCPQKSPEEQVAETRTQYFLEPTGMLVQEIEPEEVYAEDFEEGEATAAAEAAAVEGEEGSMDEEGAMEPAGARTVKVLFDLVIRFDGLREALPGITVEVVHTDPFDQEKARYLQWIETEGMRKGDARQLSFEREIPDYESGDEFSIEYRQHIPPEERGGYQEFASAGSS